MLCLWRFVFEVREMCLWLDSDTWGDSTATIVELRGRAAPEYQYVAQALTRTGSRRHFGSIGEFPECTTVGQEIQIYVSPDGEHSTRTKTYHYANFIFIILWPIIGITLLWLETRGCLRRS
jgi:hypothetical protein